jgi:hypothetical protein
VGWSQVLERLLREGQDALSVRWFPPVSAWRAYHKSVDTLLLWNEPPVVVVGLDV